jgi:N-methylhydantoinase A/oxoprolinase/acetone carboxylase beta subunit
MRSPRNSCTTAWTRLPFIPTQEPTGSTSLSRLETAEGIIRISCETMAQAVKGVVVDRVRDPRDYVLSSFGGAGPMHACFVAQAMNVPNCVTTWLH